MQVRRLLKGFMALIFIALIVCAMLFSFKRATMSNHGMKFRLMSFLKYSSIKPEFLKFMDLNFDTLVSDYFWVLFVQETSSSRLAKMHYPYMYKISVIIVSMNPGFNYAYQAAGTLLGISGKPKKAVKLLKMGMNHLDGNWNIPFLIAFNYFYSLNDPERAAYYLKYAVNMKNSPKYLEFLYMKLLNRSGSFKKALAFLIEMYKNNKNPYIRQIIKYRIYAVKKEIALQREHKKYKIPHSLKLFLPQRKL